MKKVIILTAFLVTVFSVSAQGNMLNNFVHISGGTFTMGSPVNEPERDYDEIQHLVTVSSFLMGKYSVTQKEYEEIMGTNPSSFKGQNLPIEKVSWFDAVEYCNKRSLNEGLTPAYTISGRNVTWNRSANGYRLPTEAEWEYACRAGTTTSFFTGNNITTNQANYRGDLPYNNNDEGIYRRSTTEVGSFSPNNWGLYDMHGNVFEWCWDFFGDYLSTSQTNPTGPTTGLNRVIRGGSFTSNGKYIRSAFRSFQNPSMQIANMGFRLIRNYQN